MKPPSTAVSVALLCGWSFVFGYSAALHTCPPQTAPAALSASPQALRSPRWATVRAAHLKRQPACAVCGRSGKAADLQVHHVQPYHLHPELELDPSNLMTLCPDHHLTFGHLGDWSSWNPNVREDVKAWHDRYATRPYNR